MDVYIVGQWRHMHLQIMVVHGHGRAVCAVAFVACVVIVVDIIKLYLVQTRRI